MGYQRFGIACCTGLRREALALTKILEAQRFQVVSVSCKVGRTPKKAIGVKDEKTIRVGRFESMCSPMAQARIISWEKTDFNILVGLCVGHDSLFLKCARAFSTGSVAKDRVLGHNSAAALYTAASYYPKLMRKDF
jgi:uncharacterized metal-binding protein